TPATPVDRFSPPTQIGAVDSGTAQHPSVLSAQYNVDVAVAQVKVAEGALLPNLTLQGSVQQNTMQTLTTVQNFAAQVVGQLTVPIYQGGAEYSAIRQAKETLGQRRIDLDTPRDQARQNVIESWGQTD